ncbi:MAG: PIN domain-containing protein [Casimicrobiaceae bacterium]
MTPFFDTNVVLYLLSADPAKAERAEELIAERGFISVQVLNEVTAVTRRNLGMSWREVREVRDVLAQLRAACAVAPLTVETHERGLLVAERFRLSVYDGMIVAAALLAGCSILYTEARQDGQVIDGQLTLRNPFA